MRRGGTPARPQSYASWPSRCSSTRLNPRLACCFMCCLGSPLRFVASVSQLLLGVANHFYRSIGGEWLCLEMTVDSLKAGGIKTIFEAAAPVGGTAAMSTTELFPHVYGGIPTLPGVVTHEYPVSRSSDGTFHSIQGIAP